MATLLFPGRGNELATLFSNSITTHDTFWLSPVGEEGFVGVTAKSNHYST